MGIISEILGIIWEMSVRGTFRVQRVAILLGLLPLLTACPPSGSAPPAVSLEDAKRITAEFEGPSFVPPPRTISDITSVLNEPDSKSATSLAQLRAAAAAEPPKTQNPIELWRFYRDRGRAQVTLGRIGLGIADLTKALDYVRTTKRNDANSQGVHPRGVLRILMNAHFKIGEYNRALELARELERSTPRDKAGQTIAINGYLAHFLGRIGDISGAEAAVARAKARVPETYGWKDDGWGAITRAWVSNMEGDMFYYRGQ